MERRYVCRCTVAQVRRDDAEVGERRRHAAPLLLKLEEFIAAATADPKASKTQPSPGDRDEKMSLHFDVTCVELHLPKVETFGTYAG